MRRLAVGQVVRYARPEAGEGDIRFVVREAHYGCTPERIHAEILNWPHGRIAPVEVMQPHELCEVPKC